MQRSGHGRDTDPSTPWRVAIVDAGYGGLRVAAMLAAQWRRAAPVDDVHLRFFDVRLGRPSKGRGFGGNLSNELRRRVVDRILEGIDLAFQPNLVVLACNTLCTCLSPDLIHAKSGRIRSILPYGLEAIRQFRRMHPRVPLLLAATPNTLRSEIYQRALQHESEPPLRILECPCPDFVREIECQPDPARILTSVERHMDPICGALPGEIGCGLFCTHYEYVTPQFMEALRRKKVLGHPIQPGQFMAETLVSEFSSSYVVPRRFLLDIESRVAPDPIVQSTLLPRLESIDPGARECFLMARHNPGLFNLRDFGLDEE